MSNLRKPEENKKIYEEHQKFLKHEEGGKSTYQIARELGIGQPVVWRRIKRYEKKMAEENGK